jgi:PAS domain S-box-containing protein
VEAVESYEWELHRVMLPDGRYGVVCYYFDSTRLREAEQALRQSEQHLELLRDTIPALISYVDSDGRYQSCNRGYTTWFGLTPEEVVGRPMREVVGEDAWRTIGPRMESALAGQTIEYEAEAQYARGGARWIHAIYTPHRDAAGKVQGVIVLVTDVTKSRRAEAELRASEERFRAFMDNSPTRSWVKDEEGRFVFANRAVLRALGLTAEELIGKTDADLFPAAIAEANRRNDLAVLESGAAREFAEISQEADGVHHLLSIKFPIRDAQGRLFVGGKGLDVTVQKRADEELRRSDDRFRRAADAAGALVYEVELDGPAPRAEAYGIEHVVGSEGLGASLSSEWWHERIHPGDLPAHLEHLARCLEDPSRATYSAAYRVRHTDGSWRDVQDVARIVRDENDGRALRLVGTIIDVTERTRAEQALRDADRRKDEFLATLAHELRNPLAPIRNAVQMLLLKGSGDPDTTRYQQLIERQVQHMARLLDDLLDASRISHGKLKLRRERIRLSEVIHYAVETSRPLVEKAEHHLDVDLPGEPIYLDGDPLRLSQVFLNLLNNAAKYTERGGRIRIAAVHRDGLVEVSVADNGIGISAEMLPHVFTMFSQAKSALDRSQGGLGIGLSLVRGLIELHGGSIEARSKGPGTGSEFVVRLPVAESAPEVAPETAPPALAPPVRPVARKRRILIADDMRDSADSMAVLLEELGHEVHTVYNGEDAISAAETFCPDVVLLDIGMPQLNGFDVCRRIRELAAGRDLCLVAVTGWGQEDDRRRSREAGFDHHLVKPVDPDALVSLLASLPSEPAVPNR